MGDATSLDIVIVNWNAGAQLGDCLRSLRGALGEGVALGHVVVVDNASDDGSAAAIDAAGLPLLVRCNAENRGYAAAANQGAAGSRADYLLFVNPDARLGPQMLARAVAYLAAPAAAEIGILGPRLVDAEGRTQRCCARFPTPAQMVARACGLSAIAPGRFPPHFLAEWDHATTRRVDQVMGAVFLVRGSLFRRLGGFDERFFVYYEDLDFARRARDLGASGIYLAEVEAYHRGGGTTASIKGRRLYYSLQSRLRYADKHFTPREAALVRAATLLVEPWARLAAALLQASPTAAAATIGGFARLYLSAVAPPGAARDGDAVKP